MSYPNARPIPAFHPPAFEPQFRKAGLIALSDGVRAILPARGITALVTVTGWRSRDSQTQGPGGANRISFMPGAEPGATSSDGGTVSYDEAPTRDDQVIATIGLLATVSVWAASAATIGAAYDEQAQLQAWSDLFQATIWAMHNAVDPDSGEPVGGGALQFGKFKFSRGPTNAAFGLESLLQFTHYGPILAPTIATARPQPVIEETFA